MDLDAGAEDFFAALNSGGADAFVDFGDIPAPDAPAASAGRASLDDAPLLTVWLWRSALVRTSPDGICVSVCMAWQAGKKKPEAKKTSARKDAATARATPKPSKVPDEPTLPMEERIVNLLVPEMKVADVMLLIKKMKQAGKSDADEFSELDADQKTGVRRVVKCGVSLHLTPCVYLL